MWFRDREVGARDGIIVAARAMFGQEAPAVLSQEESGCESQVEC